MSYTALRVPSETKEKFQRVKNGFPRVPLAKIADAVVDGWSLLTPEQQKAMVIGGTPAPAKTRKRKAESAMS